MTHLVWFRNNLRVRDNQVLTAACKEDAHVIGVYCFDPRQFETTAFGFPKTGAFRAKFLVETICNLKENLSALNIPLLIFQETPEAVLPKLVSEFHITAVFSQTEWTSEENKITKMVKNALSEAISWHDYYDQFLFHPEDIPYDNFSEIPQVFTEFRKKCEKYTTVHNGLSIPPKRQKTLIIPAKFKENTNTPTLPHLGLEVPKNDPRSAFPFNGGETSGLQRLCSYVWDTEHISRYKQTRNGLIGVDYSSKFSPWLANGSVSAKTIYWEVKRFENEVKKNQDTYWMLFELIWRDFFKYVSLKHGDALFKIDGILNKAYRWEVSEEKKEQWISGKTKYAFVNANMKELAKTGWMSNRGRQNVASFWAKELEQDWRIGASYFESTLIDYDVHSNWGNWQYVSGVGNDPRNRKFNIERQAAHYDPDGAYAELWKD